MMRVPSNSDGEDVAAGANDTAPMLSSSASSKPFLVDDPLLAPLKTTLFGKLVVEEALGAHDSMHEGTVIQLSLCGKVKTDGDLQHLLDRLAALSGDIAFGQRFSGARRRLLPRSIAERMALKRSKVKQPTAAGPSSPYTAHDAHETTGIRGRRYLTPQATRNTEFFEHRICLHPRVKFAIGPQRNDDVALWLEADVFAPAGADTLVKSVVNGTIARTCRSNNDGTTSTVRFLRLMERAWTLAMYGAPEPLKDPSGSKLLKNTVLGSMDSAKTKSKLSDRVDPDDVSAGATGGVGSGLQRKSEAELSSQTSQRTVYRSSVEGDVMTMVDMLGYEFAFEYTRRGYRFRIPVTSHYSPTAAGAVGALAAKAAKTSSLAGTSGTGVDAPDAPDISAGGDGDETRGMNTGAMAAATTSSQGVLNDECLVVEVFQVHRLQERHRVTTGIPLRRLDVSLMSMTTDTLPDAGAARVAHEYDTPAWLVEARYETRRVGAVPHGMRELNMLADSLSVLVELRAINHNLTKARVLY